MAKSEKTKGMIAVESKSETLRKARAQGKIIMSGEMLTAIRENTIPKGDVLEQSKIAGIMSAKKTSELIPMCHPIRITGIEINFEMEKDGIRVFAEVSAIDRAGVEMEALTAVAITCLNIYDMCKWMDKSMKISDICLLEKSGGRSGEWKRD